MSSLGQLGGAKQSTAQAPTTSTIRKRKVQPALKERAEAFLANAASDTTVQTNVTNSKKRKLQEYQDEKTSKPSAATSKSKSKSKSKASDSTPKKLEEKRLRRYREKAPKTFLEKLGRAQTQRYSFRIVFGSVR